MTAQTSGEGETPIIFSADMVRAIIAGTKTQTRRAIKPQPASGVRHSPFVSSGVEDGHGRPVRTSYVPGDRLWVREAHSISVDRDAVMYADAGGKLAPTADPSTASHCREWKLRSPIHMPRWASRLTLTITDVRVQRVQAISDDDAEAEGVNSECIYGAGSDVHEMGGGCEHEHEYIAPFKRVWDALNAKRGFSWDSNPWVWAITFERAA